jgi:hypothetical protein
MKRKTGLVIGGVVVGLGLLYFFMRSKKTAAATTITTPIIVANPATTTVSTGGSAAAATTTGKGNCLLTTWLPTGESMSGIPIYQGSTLLGVTPLNVNLVAGQSYSFTVKAPGYQTATYNLVYEPGDTPGFTLQPD